MLTRDICRETAGKTLEEMAVLFGDNVAFTDIIGNDAGVAEQNSSKALAAGHGHHLDAQHVEVQQAKSQ